MEKNGRILGAVIAVLSVLGFAVYHWLCPAFYPSWYWVIPVFYLLNAGVMYGVLSAGKGKKFAIHKHVLLKMLKLIGSLLIVVFYMFFVKANILSFIITIVVFYIVYSFLETKILLDLNRKDANNGL